MTASITRERQHISDRRQGVSPAAECPYGRRRALLLAVAAAVLVALVLALMLLSQVARADAAEAATMTPARTTTPDHDTLWQVSTYGALAAGDFAGAVALQNLPSRHTVGLGTFTGLDGEMVVLDGRIYQARSDGAVVRPGPLRRTPFACVTQFEADRRAVLVGLKSYAALQTALDRLRSSNNYFYAFRIHGSFDHLTIRTVPRQDEPYPTLSDALRGQVVSELDDVRGTLVGFWCPSWVGAINAPGYHLHFVSDDRRAAGHVLDVDVGRARAAADLTPHLRLALPGTAKFADTPF